MRAIRNIIYKLGIRPKQGSIFYSPTRSFAHAMKDAWKGF